MTAPLPPSMVRDVCARLGISPWTPPTLPLLGQLYRGWCAAVPFDNVRKSIALHERTRGPLPGSDAGDFFESWLAHGTGGTCWAGSTALHALAHSLGFDAVRAAASMRDTGEANHATVRVRIDDAEWLLDSSMLTNDLVPLPRVAPASDDASSHHAVRPPADVEVEAADGGTFAGTIVWFDAPPRPALFPCRMLHASVDAAFFLDAHERTRVSSPFNQALYARRYRDGAKTVLRAGTRVVKTGDDTSVTTLDRAALRAALHADIGISRAMVDRWAACGALDACYEVVVGPHPAEPVQLPPSARSAPGAR